MCGITGFYGFEDKARLKQMTDALAHRGPDDSGYYTSSLACLGNRRLSIIDLPGGKQPVHNENESIFAVFNGEIYNYKKLSSELKKAGHEFYTNSDTETIVHAYEEWGDAFLAKLKGMFAFAIWDEEKKRLIIARDRIGIKPLYYAKQGKKLFFASEIKALLKGIGEKPALDEDALNEFFSLGYVSGNKTLFKQVKKLEQGSCMTVDGNAGGAVSVEKYWELGTEINDAGEGFYLKSLEERLKQSVRDHLISDVPVGAFVSGGLDSSLLVALMSQISSEPLKTFSIGFGVEGFDELEHARVVSEHFNTDHVEKIIEPKPEFLMDATWAFEEPATDPAFIPLLEISREARKKVKVALTGDGADEQFAGYNVHKIMYANRVFFEKVPAAFVKATAVLPDKLKVFRGIKYAAFSRDAGETYWHYLNAFKEKNDVITLQETRNNALGQYFSDADSKNILSKMLKLDCENLLPNYFLMKTDKTTMAHSIEARVPYLDHELIEFSATIPAKLKLQGFTDKYLLRKVAQKLLPKSILKRPKQGFNVPIVKWFELGFIDVAKQFLDEKQVGHKFFNSEKVEKLLLDYKTPANARKLWRILMFQIWFKVFIESNAVKRPSLDSLLQ